VELLPPSGEYYAQCDCDEQCRGHEENCERHVYPGGVDLRGKEASDDTEEDPLAAHNHEPMANPGLRFATSRALIEISRPPATINVQHVIPRNTPPKDRGQCRGLSASFVRAAASPSRTNIA
jgi:hypothetical protein